MFGIIIDLRPLTDRLTDLVLDLPQVEGALGVHRSVLPDQLDPLLEERGTANDDVLHDGRERYLSGDHGIV